MTDQVDIVDRLRISWTSMTDMANAERLQAADEIERLRAERDEYKDAFEFAHKEFHDALDDLAKMKAERDEARREVCNLIQAHSQLWCKDVAKHRGWDCFKEDGK